MLLNCPECETRLQLDEAKTPSQPFKVRCPKCQANVTVQPPVPQPATAEATASAPTDATSLYQRPVSAPLFNARCEEQPATDSSSASPINDLATILSEALRSAGPVAKSGTSKRPSWNRRKVLVCSSPAYRETIAQLLAKHDYEVYVAENMPQALGRMREDRLDVIVLDANFDPLEQGVAFVTREIKLMRPLERRRLFVVYISSSARTMDLHAAFLHNVNLVVNPSEIEELPDALELSIRQYNELYRDFNRALEVAPI
jgi:predicted Zn finger-like uncharacterized protein